MAPPSLPQPLGRLPGHPRHPDDTPVTPATSSLPSVPARIPSARPPAGGSHDRPDRSRTFGLPAAPASVGLARATARTVLDGWGVHGELCDNAVLVLSELVTNALTHSGSDRVECRLRTAGCRLRIEVEDQNRCGSLPERREPDADDQNGRGLILVEALTDDWGRRAAAHGTGCVVWAELGPLPAGPARHRPPAPAAARTTDAPAASRPGAHAPAPPTPAPGAPVPAPGSTGKAPDTSTPEAGTSRPAGTPPPAAADPRAPAGAPLRAAPTRFARPTPHPAEGPLPHGSPAHP